MSTIVTRAGKGSALTHNEVDANFTNLNTDKLEAATSATLTNKTIALGSNTVSGTIAQFNTAVTDADLATLAGVETLTNKTMSGANNTLTNIAQSSVTNLVTDLAAKAPLTPTVENIATGSAYTLVVADNGKIKRGVDAAAQTINITTAFNGLSCTIEWLAGSGTITLDANAGVNLNGLGDGVNIVLSQAAGAVSLIPTGTNTWDVVGAIGDLVASDITNLGTGVATALTTNVGSAGAVVTNGGAISYNATVNTGDNTLDFGTTDITSAFDDGERVCFAYNATAIFTGQAIFRGYRVRRVSAFKLQVYATDSDYTNNIPATLIGGGGTYYASNITRGIKLAEKLQSVFESADGVTAYQYHYDQCIASGITQFMHFVDNGGWFGFGYTSGADVVTRSGRAYWGHWGLKRAAEEADSGYPIAQWFRSLA